jgi:hypothetical protein
MVALTPGRATPGRSGVWLEACGKTQLAASSAEWLWHSGKVDLLVWVVATSRASVLSAFVEAAVVATGADPAGDAETVAGRFISWLAETSQPWVVVLDDLSSSADLEGLRPEGPAGRVLITTRNATTIPADQRALVLQIGAFSPREALSYLMGRLTADPDQRLGAIDLVQDLGYDPLALAQASAVIASSVLSCRDYRDYFTRRREHMAQAAGGDPAAAGVTWTFSAEQAERLLPRGAQALLALAALLDGNGIPAQVFATPAACGYLTGEGAGRPAGPELARGALSVLERVGLMATGSAGTPTARVNPVIQAAVRAAAPAEMLDRAAKAAADALLEAWPDDEPVHGPLRPSGRAPPASSGSLAICYGRAAVTRSCCAPGRAWTGRTWPAPPWPTGGSSLPSPIRSSGRTTPTPWRPGTGSPTRTWRRAGPRRPSRGFSGPWPTVPARSGQIIPAPSRPGSTSAAPSWRRIRSATRSRS